MLSSRPSRRRGPRAAPASATTVDRSRPLRSRAERFDEAAEAIGIEVQELVDALRDGQTLAQIAEANGVEPQAVIDAMVAAAQERIDAAVEAGRLDEAEAAERTADLTERITALVNEGFQFGRGERPAGRQRGRRHSQQPRHDRAPNDHHRLTTLTRGRRRRWRARRAERGVHPNDAAHRSRARVTASPSC